MTNRWTVDMERYGDSTKLSVAILSGCGSLNIVEVCDLDIPPKDRLWMLCIAEWKSIGPVILAIVDRAVRTYSLPHSETRDWAERWLSGEDRSEDAVREITDGVCWAIPKSAKARKSYTTQTEALEDAAFWTAAAARDVVWKQVGAIDWVVFAADVAAAWRGAEAERECQVADFREYLEGQQP